MQVRVVASVCVLLLLVAGLGWFATPETSAGLPGDYPVYVVGPAGLIASGTVTLRDANALAVLEALAASRGFAVEFDDFQGCSRDYVRSVAGLAESREGGWNYYVRGAGRGWEWQTVSASCRDLQPGDEVEWCWVEADDVCHAHVV